MAFRILFCFLQFLFCCCCSVMRISIDWSLRFCLLCWDEFCDVARFHLVGFFWKAWLKCWTTIIIYYCWLVVVELARLVRVMFFFILSYFILLLLVAVSSSNLEYYSSHIHFIYYIFTSWWGTCTPFSPPATLQNPPHENITGNNWTPKAPISW